MTGSSGSHNVQITVEPDRSTAVIGDVKIEVTPNSNVNVYTDRAVETRPKAAVTAFTKEGIEDMQVSIGKDFNAVALYGARVELSSDNSVIVSTNGKVMVKPAPAKADPKPGDRMPDGTIFAGISPDTHEPMYTTPADASLTMKWKDAMKYAAKLDSHGHHDWRMPTKAELNVLYENRDKGALKGTFNVTGSFPAGWYWSSTEATTYLAWTQRFSDGTQDWFYKDDDSPLRYVR